MTLRTRPFLVAGLLLWLAALFGWALGLDPALHRLLHLFADGALVRPIAALSACGGLAVMGGIALAAVIGLAIRQRGHAALWLFATIASGRLFVELVKIVVERPRPPVADRLEAVTSWSFPSSHSAGTMLTGLALAAVLGRTPRAFVPALVWTVVIGWTRIALGVHWPTDVLAGWGSGLIWIGLAIRLWPPRAA